ncbi:PREDICTED: sperm acrosome membrane-associated protein 6-like isoform X1 [Ficedula albicollis]|uniref:Sperm acrosome associated 6 n=1 Tax=Ficedula albicollis TaxID=59894 RepID=U3JXD5_FICAL|nr:PREDICTED: sperm acrosome membrane-associated protein 6-like isoform X1 [Ficedula albicollis]
MGWWFVALMLVLVPWHPRNPALWLWVLMSCLPEVHPCLLCFGPTLQRARLCSYVTGLPVEHPRHKICLADLVRAAKQLASVTVGSGQREELRDIVIDAMNFIEDQKGNKPFRASLREAVNTIWVKLSELEKVPACIPPCGFQPDARVFQCATCRFVDCQFALDCPVQDLWTYTDETIVLHCNVPFKIPKGTPVTWLFVPNLRTQDMALFKKVNGNPEKPFSLTIEEPAPGTVACILGEPAKPIVRKFFYLNVSEGSVEEEKELQGVFSTVLQSLDAEKSQPPIPALGLAVAAGSTAFVLLLLATWQCLCVRQTCHRRGHQGTREDSRSLDSV